MTSSAKPTYILKFTTHTITAICSRNHTLGTRKPIHLTSVEDESVQEISYGWHAIAEGAKVFVIEVPAADSKKETIQFPLELVQQMADNAQVAISNRPR